MAVETVSESAATWTRIEDSPAWARLTPQQRVWLASFVASAGDALAATKTAYRTANDHQAQVMTWELQRKPAILDAIATANNTATTEPTKEQLISECKRQLRAAEPGSVAASRLLAQLERLTLPDKPAEEDRQLEVTPSLIEVTETPKPKYAVGQRVSQRDANGGVHYGVVRAIDANGKPSSIETIK